MNFLLLALFTKSRLIKKSQMSSIHFFLLFGDMMRQKCYNLTRIQTRGFYGLFRSDKDVTEENDPYSD